MNNQMNNQMKHNTPAVSDRGLLLMCTTLSIISFFGILFLVLVVALLVSKAVQLAENYRKVKNEVQDKAQDFIESDNFKNFQDHLVDASERALHSTRGLVRREAGKEERQYVSDPYHF